MSHVDGPGGHSERLLAAHADAAAFFTNNLSGAWVPGYLASRGLDGALVAGAPWLLGYAPGGWTALTGHLRDLGYSDRTTEESGLAVRARTGRLVDRFRDRLVLAIREVDGGQVVGFVGRAGPERDPQTPKYLNSATGAVYRKREHLFGLREAAAAIRGGATPVITEGVLDAVAVHLATGGRYAGVALCGTAMTAEHTARIAATVHAPGARVVVATDNDAAGQDAAERCFHRLRAVGLDPWAADLPPGIDPANLVAADDTRRLQSALVRARPLVDQVVDQRIARWSDRLNWVEGQVGAVRDVAPLLLGLAPAHQRRLTQRISDVTGVETTTVERELAVRPDPGRYALPASRARSTGVQTSTAPHPAAVVHRSRRS